MSFLLITRAYIWFNMFTLFSSNLECKKSWRVGIHTTLQSFHFTQRIHRHFHKRGCHPQGSLHRHVTSHDSSASPHDLCRWHTWAPCPARHILEQQSGDGTARTGCGPGSPPPLPLHGNAATDKPVHLLRKRKEATNVSSHNIHLFPPYLISFLK